MRIRNAPLRIGAPLSETTQMHRVPRSLISGQSEAYCRVRVKGLTTMKALLLSEYRHLELTDVPDPTPGPSEVLVRVAACGICGSDVHGYDGSSGRRIPPIVMGHEAAGTVAARGAQASGPQEGDRVTFDSTIYCGVCAYCRNGEMNLCENREVLGVSTPEYRRAGAFA